MSRGYVAVATRSGGVGGFLQCSCRITITKFTNNISMKMGFIYYENKSFTMKMCGNAAALVSSHPEGRKASCPLRRGRGVPPKLLQIEAKDSILNRELESISLLKIEDLYMLRGWECVPARSGGGEGIRQCS